jgi:hypothetical protein
VAALLRDTGRDVVGADMVIDGDLPIGRACHPQRRAGCPLYPGTSGASLTKCRARPAPAASQRHVPAPDTASHRAKPLFTRHQRRFTRLTRATSCRNGSSAHGFGAGSGVRSRCRGGATRHSRRLRTPRRAG